MVGYDDIEEFVRDLCDSEANHLEVYLRFCEARGLNDALRTQDWENFALRYNGPGQVAYYAAALRAAFARHSAASGGPEQPVLHLSARDPAVRRLQELLSQAGYQLKPDGIFGQETLNIVRRFQVDHRLVPDGVAGARTWGALTAG
jgi:peptidoglycan hydrolase-like protein with peptidoglycan-binding domain